MSTTRNRRTRVVMGALMLAALIVIATFVLIRPAPPAKPIAAVPPTPDPPVRVPRETVRHAEPERVERDVASAPVDATAAEEPQATVRVHVRDAWSQRGVPGIALEFAAGDAALDYAGLDGTETEAGDWLLRADDDGMLLVPAEAPLPRTNAANRDWHVVAWGDDAESDPRVLWVYADMRVCGLVEIDQPRDGSQADPKIAVTARAFGLDSYFTKGRPGVQLIDERWLHRHRLTRWDFRGAVDADGRFDVVMPRVPGLSVTAGALPVRERIAPWRPDSVRITPEQMGRRLADVRLRLRPGYEVSSVLTDANNRPVADAQVVVYVHRRLPVGEAVPSRILAIGHGYTLVRSHDSDFVDVVFQADTRTDDEGRFDLTIFTDGRAWLHVVPQPGHAVDTQEIGYVSAFDSDEARVVPDAVDRFGVKLLLDGKALASGTRVLVLDLSQETVQPSSSYTLGDDASVPARFFTRGRRYAIRAFPAGASGPPRGRLDLVWNGERELELSSIFSSGPTAGASDE